MADYYALVGDKVVPYSGGRMHTDTDSHRDATPLEIEQQARILQLEHALNKLIDIASDCDGWESFPSLALDEASSVLYS